MRIVVDLLACQTASRFRSTGRYTHSLITTMARLRGSNQLTALANAAYAEPFEELRRDFLPLLPPGSFLPYQHLDIETTAGEKSTLMDVAATLVRQTYESLTPDCVLYPGIFEGWREKGVVPLPGGAFPSALTAALVTDFLPYLYPERFLTPEPDFQHFSMRRFHALQQFDLLLAVSEATRQDAIRLLELPSERVVNISAAANQIFQKKEYTSQQLETLHRQFGISRPFIFSTGADEPHQNMDRALRAYAQLPAAIREQHQFVLADTGGASAFRATIQSYGFSDQDVIITGPISDEERVALYNTCRLYLFPALYEGSGEPILEAMACGAAVIASNTSSVPEVIGRENALFDPTDDDAVTQALQNALTNEVFREDLATYGLKRVEQFSWEKSAEKTWQALEAALEQKQRLPHTTVALPAGQAKLRVAYVSPLPPQKSGIADYSAELLPSLARHADVDVYVEPDVKVAAEVSKTIRNVYPSTELVQRQDQYDVVLYQFGNSKFHRHMYSLLKAVPGVVVLHDFYLSHVGGFIHATQYIENPQGDFLTDVGSTHGMFAMVDMVRRGMAEAMWDWPVNWNVLKFARKIIVHSDYQNTLMERFYGNGWYPRTTIIPQVHRIDPPDPVEERLAWKQKLGIDPDQFTFCSFGYVIATKLPLLIAEAFAQVYATNPQARLVFVGEIDKGEAADQLAKLLDRFGITQYVKITGFVDDETYEGYLKAADAAIQLRINSRGETSRAVLDCMEAGIPTIVNAHGSLNDYQESDVVKLPEHLSAGELAQAMIQLSQDAHLCAQLSTNARSTIEQKHNPERVAAAYYDAIVDASKTSDRAMFAPLIDAVASTDGVAETILPHAAQIAANHWNLRAQPRLLIDVTNISQVDLRSGIQRVVKNLITGLYAILPPAYHVELVRMSERKLYRSSRFAEKLFGLATDSMGSDVPIDIQPGDTLFMLDTSWNLFEQFQPIFQSVRRAGGKIYTMLYDLIPVNYPHLFPVSTVEHFQNWIKRAVVESDEIVCISKAVAGEAEQHIQQNFPNAAHVSKLSYIHLGSDIPVAREEADVRPTVRWLTENTTSPFFLMVSTIEPRKGFGFVLDAFERLWQQGQNLRLCFIGKIGWNVEELERRIRGHHELHHRLFFIENATDAEVNLCYAAATALIAASTAEGFGLPIVEAARHHVPVIASDIPVFREVGRDGPEYFSLASPLELAAAVARVANKTAAERKAMAERVPVLSWEQSAEWLLAILNGKEGRHPADPRPAALASRAWLYAPGMTGAERADFQQRLEFYTPQISDVQMLDERRLDEAVASSDPILQYCPEEALPAQLRVLVQQALEQPALKKRVFFVDPRHYYEDAYEWSSLATTLGDGVDYASAHERFLAFYHRLRGENLQKAYLFGTGPSLDRAIERDWSDGYRIVCNTIVRDPVLWKHIQPHFIVAADSRYHFGHTAFSRAFRKDLHDRLRETETYFLYPGVYDAIAQRELADVREKLLPLPFGAKKRIDVDLSVDYETPGLGNVLPLMLLPLGCTLAKHVCLWGFDGRAPTDQLFWGNSSKHNYPELMPEMMKAHPAFFESYMPKRGTNTYVQQFMGDELDQLMTDAEGRGYRFEMLHPTWTETLQKRIIDPSIPRVPE